MKYLDERIIVTLSNLNITETNTYVYEVRNTSTVLFTGNIFIESGTTTKDVDITDIVANDKWIIDGVFKHIIQNYYVRLYTDTIIDSNSVQVAKVYRYPHYMQSMNNTLFDYQTETGITRVMLQGYNNGDYKLLPKYPINDNFEINTVLESSADKQDTLITYKVEGAFEGSKTTHINSVPNQLNMFTISDLNIQPYHTYETQLTTTNCTQSTEGYKTGQMSQYTLDIMLYNYSTNQYESIYSYTDIGEEVQEISCSYRFTEDNLESIINMPVAIILDDGVDEYYINLRILNVDEELLYKDLLINLKLSKLEYDVLISDIVFRYSLNDDDTYLKIGNDTIAKIDTCVAPFYLIWQDRFGSFQVQPFNDKYTYSETFDKSEVVNYTDVRRLNNVQVQGKWKINTDWIDKDLYPYYESIFVSPILKLYDSAEDKTYNVIVTGDYTEKTYKNQKQLINLSLNLELANKQNIIY